MRGSEKTVVDTAANSVFCNKVDIFSLLNQKKEECCTDEVDNVDFVDGGCRSMLSNDTLRNVELKPLEEPSNKKNSKFKLMNADLI